MTLNINPVNHFTPASSSAFNNSRNLQSGLRILTSKNITSSADPSFGLNVSLTALKNAVHTDELAHHAIPSLLRKVTPDGTIHKLSRDIAQRLL